MATIYKIYCCDSEITDCYVGSTEDFTERCRKHKSCCYNTKCEEYNKKLYKFIRANEGMDNFIIEPIYECNVEDRYIEEQRWFELLKSTLNTKSPKRTRKEWYIDNKEKILEQRKQYREHNKQTLAEYNNQYRENNKDYFKQYRENNKETLAEKGKIKIECECGALVSNKNISTHRKTTKHQKLINSKL